MRAVFLALLLFSSAASAADAAPRASRLFEQWRRADADADGMLSRAEAARMPRLAAQFDTIDRDADLRLSADEVRAWRRASAQARRAPRRSAVDGAIELADRDGDGLLSRAETIERLPRISGKFARIDVDANQRLSREEIHAWFALRRAARRIR